MTLQATKAAMIAHAALIPEPARMAMPQTVPWTREELDRLPDDGNRYEVLNGELLVTPPPSQAHQEIVDWLNEKLTPFVTANGLGRVRFPRSVIVVGRSQLEPDMMVRAIAPHRGWANAPPPILVVEVLSRATRRRDLNDKRDFYMENGIAEYWAVDRDTRSIIRFTPGSSESVSSVLTWIPRNIEATLDIDVTRMFAETQVSS
jgi:Uma2 family endonuclease